MPFINDTKYDNARIAFSAKFNQAFDRIQKKMDPVWGMLGYEIPLAPGEKTLDLKWIGDVPAMTEWIGERRLAKLRLDSYQIHTKKWANGFVIDEDDIEDDRLNLYNGKVAALARKAMTHKMNLLMDFLVNGFATTKYGAGYDGVAFFAATHKHAGAGAAQTNIVTNEPTLDDTGAFDTAVQIMSELEDESGEPLNMTPTHLFYGPKYRSTVNTLIKADRLANGGTNTNFNAVTPVLAQKLKGAYANYWFLADLSGAEEGIAPIIWAQKRAPRIRLLGTAVGGQESEGSFAEGVCKVGADYRANAGYGIWEAIVGSRGTS